MFTNIAKIDFIVCLREGSWHCESHDVPVEIGLKSNEEILKWANDQVFVNRPSIFFVGVYWRDPNVDEISRENPLN